MVDGNFPQLGRNSFIKLKVALKEGRVYDVWKRARELWEDGTRQRVEEDTLRKPSWTKSRAVQLIIIQRDILQIRLICVMHFKINFVVTMMGRGQNMPDTV